MAEQNEQVMAMVRRELERRPDVDLRELYARAQEIDPAIGDLDIRQFNARYPLQVKRARRGSSARQEGAREQRATRGRRTRTAGQGRTAGGSRRGQAGRAEQARTAEQSAATEEAGTSTTRRRRRRGGEPNREAIRGVLLQFASDFAQAETRSEIVSVLSNVDTYVDDVVKLVGRS